MKTILLAIDMQNDFCNPQGKLYIPNAEHDVTRLSNFIKTKGLEIDNIILTQDYHQVLDIAHPGFWHNNDNEHPMPFTNINAQDVESGKWHPLFERAGVIEYLKTLALQKEYQHTIWPEHCLMGSWGAAIAEPLLNAVIEWTRTGKLYNVVLKGQHPLTEHFGAFRANVPIQGAPETQVNKQLISQLDNADRVLIAGEAKSHCVANTIKQLFDFDKIMKKLYILEDCTSNVPNCEDLATPIYERAKKLGAKMISIHEL